MAKGSTLAEVLEQRGVSRRAFLKHCAALASIMALPPSAAAAVARALEAAPRQSVIWLSFQECTGCTESLTRSDAPTLEGLIFDFISLDYHHTLQAASGTAAEAARQAAMDTFSGRYLLIVDGSVPLGESGAYSTIAGRSNLDLLRECAEGAAAVIAVGTCAAFGGLPGAEPNPTGAASVGYLMDRGLIPQRALVNVSGCPPIPVVIAGVLAHFLAFGKLPALDALGRPLAFYGDTVHERCSRLHYFDEGKFAKSFDDEGARNGWCLYELGCKGPVTYNACPTLRWNEGTSFPIQSGHPCIGCAEPDFWDRWSLYQRLAADRADLADGPEAAPDGALLFDGNCVYCHELSPKPFSTAVDQIPELLRSGSVPAHAFSFTDEELRGLVDYLKALAR